MGKVKKEDREKSIRDFCDIARRRGNVEWRSAVIEEERKEFFRGKDLLRYCEKNPECLDGVCDAGRPVEERVEELCNTMLKMQLVFACDRFYKKPHPGRKHLVKFPRKLAARQRTGQTWDPEAFYCWLEDRPMPPWQIALSMMMAVVVMSLCLFPLAPYKLRLAVVYFFLGLLGVIFSLIAVRVILFLLVFTLSGYEFWLFPNMLSDQVDIVGAFKPLLSFGKPEDGQSHLGTRIGGLVGTSLMIYMMYAYSPDERTIKKNLKQANENILDMFHSGTTKSIGDGTGYQPPKFGSDRHIDVGSIRQHIMNEKIRKREEAARAKKQGVEGITEESQDASNTSDTSDSQPASESDTASESDGVHGTDAESKPGDDSEPEGQDSDSAEDAPHTEL